MLKRAVAVMILALAIALVAPVGSAQSAISTQASAQAQADAVLAYGPYLANTPSGADHALPSGIWGWNVCIAAAVVWIGGNALVAAKFIGLVRKAGSIKAAISEIQAKAARLPKAQRRAAITGSMVAVGTDVLGLDTVIDKCFD